MVTALFPGDRPFISARRVSRRCRAPERVDHTWAPLKDLNRGAGLIFSVLNVLVCC
jgi:hypothetical protein